MAIKRELFINAIELIEVDGSTNIPTVLHYQTGGYAIGSAALHSAESAADINENFKLELGNQDPEAKLRKQFETASGRTKSAHALTKDFVDSSLEHVNAWINSRALQPADRILVAEPIAMGETDDTRSNWLTQYRAHMRRILQLKFKDVDFLPEPFAVFQYYRYGIRHPLIAQQTKHVALVLDFGGGTFDVSVIETTSQGDISAGGKNSRPLAAASIPVGGHFINRAIAEALLFDVLGKQTRPADIQTALRSFDIHRNSPLEELEKLRSDLRNFIKHFKQTLRSIERAKVSICTSILDWDLDAAFKQIPAHQIQVPREPLKSDPNWSSVRLDAIRLREIFERKIWAPKLLPSITNALARARLELDGKRISVVLLSGGSSNIRWLGKLIHRDLSHQLQDVEQIELQENFQEIVAKGLAVECARRTYGSGDSDFRAVTYNQLCIALRADDGEVEFPRCRSGTDEIQLKNSHDGVLLPSAALVQRLIDRPITWKVRLKHPPRRVLDYYFMRTSFDYTDIHNVHNVDHRVVTPRDASFDSSVTVELTIRDDGTTTPRFIYRQKGPDVPEISVAGNPFFLDMTFGSESSVGKAYIGFDFGTSNSSFSYVESGAVREYTDRSKDSSWLELSDLVPALPFPVASPLARFISKTTKQEMERLGLEALEAFLSFAAYVSYAELRTMKGKAETRIFKGFSQRSAGPLWALLQACLSNIGSRAHFAKAFKALIEPPLFDEIDRAVSSAAAFKHGKPSSIDYVRILGFLGNVTARALSQVRFGSFENVNKVALRSEYRGYFRCARGPSYPFLDLHSYIGRESFSDLELYLIDVSANSALKLTPFFFWKPVDSDAGSVDPIMYLYDIWKSDYCTYKAVDRSAELDVGESSDLCPLKDDIDALKVTDTLSPLILDVRLEVKERQ